MHVTHADAKSREDSNRGGAFVVTLVSGKGGVGKTNLAVNLGLHFAQRALRTTLFDAGLGLANADLLLNTITPPGASTLLDPQQDLDEFLSHGPCGLRVLTGPPSGAESAFDAQDALWILERLRTICDAVVVDCGNAMNAALSALVGASSLLLLTTTPEPTAIADAYAMLKYLHHRGFEGPVGLLVNMARSPREAQLVNGRLQKVAQQFLGRTLDDFGWVPLDRHVPRAVHARRPLISLYPACPASQAIARLSLRILPDVHAPLAAAGVWTHLAGVFL